MLKLIQCPGDAECAYLVDENGKNIITFSRDRIFSLPMCYAKLFAASEALLEAAQRALNYLERIGYLGDFPSHIHTPLFEAIALAQPSGLATEKEKA